MLVSQILSWQIVSSRTLTKPLVLKNGKPAGRGSITVSQLRNKCLQSLSFNCFQVLFLVSGLNAVSLFYSAIKHIFFPPLISLCHPIAAQVLYYKSYCIHHQGIQWATVWGISLSVPLFMGNRWSGIPMSNQTVPLLSPHHFLMLHL